MLHEFGLHGFLLLTFARSKTGTVVLPSAPLVMAALWPAISPFPRLGPGLVLGPGRPVTLDTLTETGVAQVSRDTLCAAGVQLSVPAILLRRGGKIIHAIDITHRTVVYSRDIFHTTPFLRLAPAQTPRSMVAHISSICS